MTLSDAAENREQRMELVAAHGIYISARWWRYDMIHRLHSKTGQHSPAHRNQKVISETEKKTMRMSVIYLEQSGSVSDGNLELKTTKKRNKCETEEKKTEKENKNRRTVK